MTLLSPPETAVLEVGDHRVSVEIASLAPTGVIVTAEELPAFSVRQPIRVHFPCRREGAATDQVVVLVGEVIAFGRGGLAIELGAHGDTATRYLLQDWSAGRPTPTRRRPAAPPRASSALRGPSALAESWPLEVRPRAPGRRPAAVEPGTPPGARVRPPPSRTRAEVIPGRSWRTTLAGLEVLVVEDDSGVARYLETGLRRHGGTIHLAEDGIAALSILGDRRVDAMLLDWMLPRMSGDRVLAEVRKIHPAIPIAVVSGIAYSAEVRNEVRRMGANELFPKPFELWQISEWITRVLPRRASG